MVWLHLSGVQGISFIFIWHSEPDACEQCRRLDGRQWVDQDLFQNTLWDVFEGDIWDLNIDFPLTHGGTGANCRCTLETKVIVDFDKIQEIKELTEFIKEFSQDIEKTSGNSIPDLSKNQIEEYDTGKISELRDNIQALKTELAGMTLSYGQLRELETLLQRTMHLIQSQTNDPNLNHYIDTISRTMTLLRQLQLTIRLTQAASGPIGWAMLGVSTIATIYTAEATANDLIRGTS